MISDVIESTPINTLAPTITIVHELVLHEDTRNVSTPLTVCLVLPGDALSHIAPHHTHSNTVYIYKHILFVKDSV